MRLIYAIVNEFAMNKRFFRHKIDNFYYQKKYDAKIPKLFVGAKTNKKNSREHKALTDKNGYVICVIWGYRGRVGGWG